MNNLFDILYIHGQCMGEIIIFNIPTNSKPCPFGDHIVFFQLIIIFCPFLHGKTWCVVSHFKINNVTSCTSCFLLNVKNHPLKNNLVFFCCDFNHWCDFGIFKTCTALFGTFFKIKFNFWCFFIWRHRSFQRFNRLTIFLHRFFHHSFAIWRKIFS